MKGKHTELTLLDNTINKHLIYFSKAAFCCSQGPNYWDANCKKTLVSTTIKRANIIFSRCTPMHVQRGTETNYHLTM